MATAADICTRALKLIKVCPVGQEPDAADAADALVDLNGLFAELEAQGCDLSWTEMTPASDIPIGEGYHRALVDLLAARMAPTYETAHPVPGAVTRARRTIMASFHQIDALQVDAGLQNLPSSYWTGLRVR